jgi:hypothetical protein
MRNWTRLSKALLISLGLAALFFMTRTFAGKPEDSDGKPKPRPKPSPHLRGDAIVRNGVDMITEGRQIFRFDTFGDEAFWGGALRLHEAIEGAAFGGVGPGVSPRTALSLGLKVDGDALPKAVIGQIEAGKVNLDDPAVTLALLRLDAVVGVRGFFNDGSLRSVGITCALCHSTVDDSVAPGIGDRLDGWANRDLNVGAIVAAAPTLAPFATLLGVDEASVRTVLLSWGPGKFDAELILDGKAFRPMGNRRPHSFHRHSG